MPAPLIDVYAVRDNRDHPNPVACEEPEDQLETDSAEGSNGGQPESSPTTRKRGWALQWPLDGQPESSATAAKRGAPQEPQTPRTL